MNRLHVSKQVRFVQVVSDRAWPQQTQEGRLGVLREKSQETQAHSAMSGSIRLLSAAHSRSVSSCCTYNRREQKEKLETGNKMKGKRRERQTKCTFLIRRWAAPLMAKSVVMDMSPSDSSCTRS